MPRLRSMALFVAGFLCGALVLAAGYQAAKGVRSADSTSAVDIGGYDPEAMFEDGLSTARERGEGLNRGDLLTQAALHRLVESPQAAPALWSRFRTFLSNDKKLSPVERLARLQAFQANVEAALPGCRSQAACADVWSTRQAIAKEVEACRTELLAKIGGSADCLRGKLPMNTVEALGAFTSFMEQHVSELTMLAAEANADKQPDIESIRNLARDLFKRVRPGRGRPPAALVDAMVEFGRCAGICWAR